MTDLSQISTGALMQELLKRMADDSTRGPLSLASFQLMRATDKTWMGSPEEGVAIAIEACGTVGGYLKEKRKPTPSLLALRRKQTRAAVARSKAAAKG